MMTAMLEGQVAWLSNFLTYPALFCYPKVQEGMRRGRGIAIKKKIEY